MQKLTKRAAGLDLLKLEVESDGTELLFGSINIGRK
jgi:hypothetical protein